ncbi:MAG: 30S ribosomal protein S20 [Candidatus Moranbacteria bacterium]|nr:30S ribosomal protein S20 [Candidatus Moranbacteria bacterium]
MPILKAAKKYIKVSAKKNVFNRKRKIAMKEAIRKVTDAITAKNRSKAEKLFKDAQKAIDKAMKRGVLKKNTAARRKSTLIRKITALKK